MTDSSISTREQVDRGDSEVLRKELDKVLLGHGADLHQRRADAAALVLLQGETFLQLLRTDLAGFEEGVSEAIAHLFKGLSWLATSRICPAWAEPKGTWPHLLAV